jgi:hypothetical protein
VTETPDWAREQGLSQVVCACLCENFHFVVSELALRMVCVSCRAVNAEIPVSALPGGMWQPGRMAEIWPAQQAPPLPQRDVVAPGTEQRPPQQPRFDGLDGLLSGGPYDGMLVRVPADVTTYYVGSHVGAAWVGELAEGPVVSGPDLTRYDQAATRPDGVRLFTWVR